MTAEPPPGNPYQPQPPQGQPYGDPQGGQPYGNRQGGQSYGDPQGGQPYGNPQGGQPYGNPQGGQPYGQPQGGQPPYGNPQGQPYGGSQGGYGPPQGGYNEPQGGYGDQQQSYGAPYGGQPYGAQPGYPSPYGAQLPPGAPAPLAEWWERLVARIIDGLIFAVVYWILLRIFTSIFSPSLEDVLSGRSLGSLVLPGVLAGIIAFALYAAYDYVLHSKDGQTFGKKALQIRLARVGGGEVDSSAVMKRAAIYPGVMVLYGIPILGWLVFIFLVVLGILILVDKPLQQGLHDKVAGTVVVKAPR